MERLCDKREPESNATICRGCPTVASGRLCISEMHSKVFLCIIKASASVYISVLIYGIIDLSNISNVCMHCLVVRALVDVRHAISRCSLLLIKELFVRRLLLLGMLGGFLLRGA